MYLSKTARAVLWVLTLVVLGFLYAPLVIIAVLSFNKASGFAWPPTGFTTHWWGDAIHSQGVRDALWTSIRIAGIATLIAVFLGTLAAFALQRFAFFGRNAVNLLLVLPIALPGIVTGIALNSAAVQSGIGLGFFTVVVGHGTFCIVVVFNNVVARLRRLPASVEEASGDLGGDIFQTFGFITFPMIRSALMAGALLAFGLSFDEIVVTSFTAGPGITTLPQYILNNIFRGHNIGVVNAVATFVVLLSVIPVLAAQKLSDGTAGVTGGR